MRSARLDRYSRDGALVAGGLAAILLQLADPVVAHGVAVRSGFARDPLRRLRNTLSFVYAVMAGDERQAGRAAELTGRAHRGVPGAFDVDRQLWVAATLYATGRAVYERLGGRIDPAFDEELLAASGRLGAVLQVPPGRWPEDRAAFERYWADAVAALAVDDEARAVAAQLLHPAAIPWWSRPAMPLVRAITPALLPEAVARAYGMPVDRGRAAWALLRAMVRLTPWRLRSLPARRLLASL